MIWFYREMAFQRKAVIDNIRNLVMGSRGRGLAFHTLLMVLYPDTTYTDHWSKEIANMFYSILNTSRLLKSNNKLKDKEIYKLVFLEPFDDKDKAEFMRKRVLYAIGEEEMKIKYKFDKNSSKEDLLMLYDKINNFYKTVLNKFS